MNKNVEIFPWYVLSRQSIKRSSLIHVAPLLDSEWSIDSNLIVENRNIVPEVTFGQKLYDLNSRLMRI